jgi:hypothetical protein
LSITTISRATVSMMGWIETVSQTFFDRHAGFHWRKDTVQSITAKIMRHSEQGHSMHSVSMLSVVIIIMLSVIDGEYI